MQVYRVLKSREKARIYYEVILPSEIFSIRWLCILGLFFTGTFIIIDYWRAEHYHYVLVFRGLSFLAFAGALLISLRTLLNVDHYQIICYTLTSVQFAAAFMVDYLAGMPVFFLPNILVLYAFGFNATLGHPLNFKAIQMAAVSSLYVIYAFYFSPSRGAHLAQSWNIVLTCALSLLIGFLIERHRLMNFVHRTQLLESRRKNFKLNKLKTKLISVLSHDLAAPLNTLVGLLHLKNQNLLSDDELAVHSRKVEQSLSNLSTMLANLLRWSKSQLEGFAPRIEKIEPHAVVDDVIQSTAFAAMQKNISIDNITDKTDHLMLDKEILKIVVRNFLTNAIKFSYPDGKVIVSSSQSNGSYTLSVKDYGTGMTQEQLEKLFVPGKNSSPGTLNETGSGIGLLITKDFVEMLGGTIAVKSEIKKGTEFSMTVPMRGSE